MKGETGTHYESRRGERTPEYEAWASMKSRCNNPNRADYKNYGGRGIYVTIHWDTYPPFLEDMGRRPSAKHTLDRIDNNGPYCRDNCRWATRRVQAHNKRVHKNQVTLTLNATTRTVAEWSQVTGISEACIRSRLKRGWLDERILTER